MKKITLFLTAFGLSMALSAQTKITFEDAAIGSTGGATAMWNAGTVDVVANTYTTGNASAKALHVLNTNYLPIYFENVAIPAGAETVLSKIKVKFLIIGGTDTNYPTLEIFSSPNSTTAGATEKIGEVPWAGLWGTAEIGIWKTVEFAFANATLKPVPAGNLILKLSKSNTEYLIDDVELVVIPVATPVILINDFEANAINDVLNMKRYSTTDASATVEANPTDAAKKSAHITAINWNSCLKQNVVLPAGKVLADYNKLSFDIYLNNIVDVTDNLWKNMEVYVDGTKVIDIQSQGVSAAWETKEYTLDNLAGANAFVLDIGLNTNKANYYLDNIKLTEKGTNSITQTLENPIIVYCTGNTIHLSQLSNQVDVIDINGRLLASAKNTSSINVSNLSTGVYMVKVNVNGQTQVVKVVR